jgi:2-oxoisovalerate ferredoxin oxidoreductase alpha subunit
MSTKLVEGNTAVVIGALYAGCDCYFGYPITPASEILHDASNYFPLLGRKFVQAESEEAAINMVYGAAAAGHRVLTASSGPGMSLKQEGISYIAAAELPCVITDIQRAGPGLGNIGPEQSDYNQVVKGGGHGGYQNIVYAPNSVQELCDMTLKAFDVAEKYRNPVVILADGMLGHMVEPLRFPERAHKPSADTSWAICGNKETRKNYISSILMDLDQLEAHNRKLQAKYKKIREGGAEFERYMSDDAAVILVSYGISSRIAKTAVDAARAEGLKAGLLRPKTLFPFPEKELKELADRGCEFISVEMSGGQMREDVRLATCKDAELVNRMGGNIIEMRAIVDKIKEVLRR